VAKSSALRAEAAAGRPLRAETGDGMGAERANHIANPTIPEAIPDLDRLIHERIRLGIVSALAAAKNPLTFNDLKHLLRTTDGNLSVHARKLEEAKYIGCVKSFEGRVPKTEYSLTAAGRRAFEKYLDHMEAIIQASKR
jgi:DNA-binding HxlR family transcriptional regulator